MITKINAILGFAILAVAAYVGFELLQSRVTNAVYRDRLVELADDYESLRERYNAAVRRTAVTELLVEDGKICVRIRNAEGLVKVVDTPFDADREIYVDYVVVDGRLWIRRVFDDQTAPSDAIVIEPKLAEIDWSAPDALHGKAAYRQLSDGTWIVTITGDGSLGLAKLQNDEAAELVHAPPVRQFEPIEDAIEQDLDRITVIDLLKQAAP